MFDVKLVDNPWIPRILPFTSLIFFNKQLSRKITGIFDQALKNSHYLCYTLLCNNRTLSFILNSKEP